MKAKIERARIATAIASPSGPNLNVTWTDGRKDPVDLSGWIGTGGDLLAPLLDSEVFRAPQIAEHGAAIAWGDVDGDLAIDALHLRRLADEQKPFGSRELAAWQQAAGFSNQEAKDFLGVSLSTFNAYKAGARIPPSIGMVCRAAQRDPILMQAHYRPRRNGRPRKRPDAA